MFTQDIFGMIKDFGVGRLVIDWSCALEDQETVSELMELCDMISIALSFVPDIEESKRIQLLGEISATAARLGYAFSIAQDEEQSYRIANELEATLRKVAQLHSVIELAQQRLPAFAKAVEQDQDIQDAENFIFFQPVTLISALAQLINMGQEDEYETEEEHEDDEDDCCQEQ